MSALAATTTSQRHITGDMVFRQYDVTGTNGDTLTVPQSNIVYVAATPTTAIAVGVTISGSILTFVTAGAFTASVGVWSREG